MGFIQKIERHSFTAKRKKQTRGVFSPNPLTEPEITRAVIFIVVG